MSVRGLVVALLCGLLGLGGGALTAYVAQPRPSYGGAADPVPAVSPSVPLARASRPPYAKDNHYPTLSPDLSLPVVHTMHNHLAAWTYHVPLGWQAFDATTDAPLEPGQIARSQAVRFKPAGSPDVGDYSLYVRVVNNTIFDPSMSVAAKITGFGEATGVADYSVLRQTPDSVYFEYRDHPTNLHRFNFFEWFAAPGSSYATLQVSVAGRQRDVPGLRALLNRFADNVMGGPPPLPHPPSTNPTTTGPTTSVPTTGATSSSTPGA